jgi:hypothetical protein
MPQKRGRLQHEAAKRDPLQLAVARFPPSPRVGTGDISAFRVLNQLSGMRRPG